MSNAVSQIPVICPTGDREARAVDQLQPRLAEAFRSVVSRAGACQSRLELAEPVDIVRHGWHRYSPGILQDLQNFPGRWSTRVDTPKPFDAGAGRCPGHLFWLHAQVAQP